MFPSGGRRGDSTGFSYEGVLLLETVEAFSVVILLVHKPYERLRYEIRPQRFNIGTPCKSEKLYEGLGKGLGNPSHFGIKGRLRTEIALTPISKLCR
jgi:hypothetical protein